MLVDSIFNGSINKPVTRKNERTFYVLSALSVPIIYFEETLSEFVVGSSATETPLLDEAVVLVPTLFRGSYSIFRIGLHQKILKLLALLGMRF